MNRATAFVVALAILAGAFSSPAVACLCSCSIFSSPEKSSTVAAVPADYREIFAGLVIATKRINEPVAVIASPDKDVRVDPGYWIKSQVLVLRVWRGKPATVAEVWTPVQGDCALPPIAGSYFVALVRAESGRSVARNSPCDCALKAAARADPGELAFLGVAIPLAGVAVVAFTLFSLVRASRRRPPASRP